MAAAVLFSSGLDSAVLAASEARVETVHPIYVSCGLAWEAEELRIAERLLATPAYRGVQPIARLTFTVADLYPPTHWALQGTPPAFDTPDEDVYLTGRNLVLLTKAGVHCAQQRVSRIAIGTLAGNPFPDATPDFFNTLAKAMSLGLPHPIAVALHSSATTIYGCETPVPVESGRSPPTVSKASPMAARPWIQAGSCVAAASSPIHWAR